MIAITLYPEDVILAILTRNQDGWWIEYGKTWSEAFDFVSEGKQHGPYLSAAIAAGIATEHLRIGA